MLFVVVVVVFFLSLHCVTSPHAHSAAAVPVTGGTIFIEIHYHFFHITTDDEADREKPQTSLR